VGDQAAALMRSEDDILAGVLRVRLGKEEKTIRELYIEELDEWKKLFAASISGLDQLDSGSPGQLGQLMNAGGNTVLDLVLAYDKEEVLGGRDWIRKHASERQVYQVFRGLLDEAFPFIADALGALAQVQAIREAVQSEPANLPNGHSPTGVSIPARSGKG
jgi:hypothetical protein